MSLNQFPRRSFVGSSTLQTFTGNGSTTTFTLSSTQTQNECFVFVDDVIQVPGTDFTVNGTTLTFTSAPANSAEIIVRGFGVPAPVTTVSDGSVTAAKLATGAIEAKLGYTPVSPTQLSTEVANLVDAAPSTLNTLNELAAALGDDPNYATTITTALGTKANSSDVNSALALKANTSSLGTLASVSPTGTANTTTFLRGDNSWQVVAVTPTAVSDQNNTSTGYFDLPVGTTAQRPGSATTGNIRYNSEITGVEYYDGSSWKQIEVVEADPYWASVVLSMNGGTLTDYKSRHTFNTVNVSTSSSPGKPFPNARESSWYYIGNGTNNYIDVLSNINDFDPQLYTNFTIEFWLNHSGQTSSYGHFYNIGGQDGQGVIKFAGNNTYGLYWYSSNGEMINFGGSGSNPANTWNWWVYEKNGSTNTTWKNGVRVSQNTNTLPSGNPLYLRLGGPFGSEYSGHYFDELRVTTVARYQGAASIPIQTKSWPKQ